MKLDPSAFVADPDLIVSLEKHCTTISCEEERVLFNQGDNPKGLYILNRGQITLTMASSSGEQVVSVDATAGSLVGLPGLISGEPYTLTAVAHDGAELSFVPRDEFTSLMQSSPLLAIKMLQVLAAELRSARHALSTL